MPARRQSRDERRRAPPGRPRSGPNMVPTQAVKNTTSAPRRRRSATRRRSRRAGAGRRRAARGDHSGSTSASITLRPSAFGTGDQRRRAACAATVERDGRRPGGARPVPGRAAPAPACDRAGRCSARSRLTRSPVLISTGQAVWHMPSTAQVSTRVVLVLVLELARAARCRRPARRRCISRRSTIRCRGVVVRSLARADRLAVAALHAAVDLGLDGRGDLEVAAGGRRRRR